MKRNMWTLASRALLVASLLLASPGSTPAQEHSHDATSTHSFEDVEHWTAVFDDPTRDAWQKPAAVVAALRLTPGMRVADLGAGTGYLESYLSKAVGPDGWVLAADTETALVEHLRTRAEQEGLLNVTPILASVDDPRIPTRSVDLVVVLDTWHHISNRLTYAPKLQRTLRPGGRVAIIDWQKRKLPVGPKPPHKLPRAHVRMEMEKSGYELVEAPDVLPYQYFLIFRPKG